MTAKVAALAVLQQLRPPLGVHLKAVRDTFLLPFQVLNDLTNDLTLKLIRSIDLASPQLLLLLPVVLHRYVITAMNPSVESQHSLHLYDFCAPSLEHAAAATATLTDLTDLSFDHQLLPWTTDMLRPVLTSLSKLTSLSLQDTGLPGRFCWELGVLSCLEQLQALNLSHNCLDSYFTALSHTLPLLRHLRMLDLSKTASPTSDLHPLAEALHQMPSLEKFAIGGIDNFRRPTRSQQIVLLQSLLHVIETLASLPELLDAEAVFSGLRLTIPQLAQLTRGLGHLTALTRLRISTSALCQPSGNRAHLGVHDCFESALARALPQLPAMQVLDLGFDAKLYGNKSTFYDALGRMTSLRELRLRGLIACDHEDATTFAAACARLPLLSCIELTGPDAALPHPTAWLRALAQLSQLPGLRLLRGPLLLDNSPFKDSAGCADAVCMIASAMQRLTLRLDVAFNADRGSAPAVRPWSESIAALLPAVVSFSFESVGPGCIGAAAGLLHSQPLLPGVTSLALLCTGSMGAPELPQLLCSSSGFSRLRALELDVEEDIFVGGGGVDRERIEGVVEAVARLQGLTSLLLSGGASLSGSAVMAGCVRLPRLRQLRLKWGSRPQTVMHVAPLPSLRSLLVWNAVLPDVEELCDELSRLSSLRVLRFSGGLIPQNSEVVKQHLQERMPHVHMRV